MAVAPHENRQILPFHSEFAALNFWWQLPDIFSSMGCTNRTMFNEAPQCHHCLDRREQPSLLKLLCLPAESWYEGVVVTFSDKLPLPVNKGPTKIFNNIYNPKLPQG